MVGFPTFYYQMVSLLLRNYPYFYSSRVPQGTFVERQPFGAFAAAGGASNRPRGLGGRRSAGGMADASTGGGRGAAMAGWRSGWSAVCWWHDFFGLNFPSFPKFSDLMVLSNPNMPYISQRKHCQFDLNSPIVGKLESENSRFRHSLRFHCMFAFVSCRVYDIISSFPSWFPNDFLHIP